MLRTIASLCMCCSLVVFESVHQCAAVYPVLTSSNITIMRAKVNNAVTLECSITNGATMSSFTWYKENGPIVRSNLNIMSTQSSSTLTLRSLESEDGGWYTCRATNNDGYDYRDFLLIVGRPPIVSTQPVSVTTLRNHTVPFACRIDATPSPTLTWYMRNLGDSSGGMKMTVPMCGNTQQDVCVNPNDFQLEVKVTMETQTFEFYCTGQNEHGSATTNTVNVTRAQDMGGMKTVPQSRMGLSVEITYGQSASLNCVDSPRGTFSIDWYLNGVRNSTYRNQVSISATERGVYCCKLTENGNLAATFCTYVLVRTHPDVVHSGSDLISIDAGRTIAVLCSGTGVNDPQVQFLKDSTLLQSSGKFEISPDSQSYKIGHFLLYSSAVNDTGSYSCRAFNFLSTSMAPFQIIVVNPYVGTNYLSNSGLEEGDSGWQLQSSGNNSQARSMNKDGDKVMYLSYDNRDAASSVYVWQNFSIPSNVTVIRLGARMRQDASKGGQCTPVMVLSVRGSSWNCYWANSSAITWQWTSCDVSLPSESSDSSFLASMLLVIDTNASSSQSAGVLFDDVFVLPLNSGQPTTTTPTPDLIPIIAGAAGGGAVLLCLCLLLFIITCYCCCCRSKKSNAESMKKGSMKRLSTRLSNFTRRYRQSAAISEEERKYASLRNQNPPTIYAGLNREGQMYVTVSGSTEEQTYEDLDKDYDYIDKPESIPEPKLRSPSQNNLLISDEHKGKISVTSISSHDFPAPPPANGFKLSEDPYLQLIDKPKENTAGDDGTYEFPGTKDSRNQRPRPKLVHQIASNDSYVSVIAPDQQ